MQKLARRANRDGALDNVPFREASRRSVSAPRPKDSTNTLLRPSLPSSVD